MEKLNESNTEFVTVFKTVKNGKLFRKSSVANKSELFSKNR